MAFAFNPDDRPPRLIRYVEAGTLPAANLLSLYDKKANLLIIDREYFDRLNEYEQRTVLRTQRSYLEIEHLPNKAPRIAA
jgi:hypothetical protein